jgi:hypothetical protein
MRKLEIEIPNDKEIDWEASAKQKQIVFKDKQLTYENMCKELFKNGYCYADPYEILANGINMDMTDSPLNAKTKHQLACILAKNKLANVAVFLNNGWKPNLEKDFGCCLELDCYDQLIIDRCAVLCTYSSGKVMFKTEELAQQALEILGEETVKLALEPLY